MAKHREHQLQLAQQQWCAEVMAHLRRVQQTIPSETPQSAATFSGSLSQPSQLRPAEMAMLPALLPAPTGSREHATEVRYYCRARDPRVAAASAPADRLVLGGVSFVHSPKHHVLAPLSAQQPVTRRAPARGLLMGTSSTVSPFATVSLDAAIGNACSSASQSHAVAPNPHRPLGMTAADRVMISCSAAPGTPPPTNVPNPHRPLAMSGADRMLISCAAAPGTPPPTNVRCDDKRGEHTKKASEKVRLVSRRHAMACADERRVGQATLLLPAMHLA
jgi:hypothetical protein